MTTLVTGASGLLGAALVRTLVARGERVRGWVLDEQAARRVADLGATPVRGDVRDRDAVAAAVEGCARVVHAAALTRRWPDPVEAWEVNVVGTRNVLSAAVVFRVERIVHVSSEAVLAGAQPLVDVDETWPLAPDPLGVVPRTRAEAERVVGRAVAAGAPACVVRPRLLWGAGDTSLLPAWVAAARAGRLRWLDGGRYLTSTCHVANAVEGTLRALDVGRPGQTWFLTDGAPVVYRDWLSDMLRTQGVTPPSGELPFRVAWAAAGGLEAAWRATRRRRAPPVERTTLALLGRSVTVRDDKARAELGYIGAVTLAAGLSGLADAHRDR